MKPGISLHIGINDIAPEFSGGFRTLVASENDARAMYDIANASGFVASTLLGEEATRCAIIERIRGMAPLLSGGGTFLITFSGHGSFVRDPRRKEPFNAEWCAYDAPIVDDELRDLLTCFDADVDIIVISDSCTTGTMTDMLAEAKWQGIGKSISTDVTTRMYYRHISEHGLLSIPCSKRRVSAKTLLISASQDMRHDGLGINAFDAGQGEHYSKFTSALRNVWDDGRFQGDYYELFLGIQGIVSAHDHQPAPMYPRFHVQGMNFEYWREKKAFQIN